MQRKEEGVFASSNIVPASLHFAFYFPHKEPMRVELANTRLSFKCKDSSSGQEREREHQFMKVNHLENLVKFFSLPKLFS